MYIESRKGWQRCNLASARHYDRKKAGVGTRQSAQDYKITSWRRYSEVETEREGKGEKEECGG